MSDDRIQLARDLFAAWSSGDPDAPERYLHPDAVLHDIVGGEHIGWPEIRDFFAVGLKRWPDLVLEPDQFWTSDDGTEGRRWQSPAMTWLRIVDRKVMREVDFHDRGAPAASVLSR